MSNFPRGTHHGSNTPSFTSGKVNCSLGWSLQLQLRLEENGVDLVSNREPQNFRNSSSIFDGVLARRRTTQEAVAKESKSLRPQRLGEYVRRHQFRLQVAELCVLGLDKVASKVVLDIDMAGSLRYVRDLGELDDSLVVLSIEQELGQGRGC